AYDADRARLEELGGRMGCRAAGSAEEAVADPSVGAVVAASPSFLHAPTALLAARAGKHVLLEKPLSTGALSGQEAIERCRGAGVVLSVVSQKRFEPGALQLKAALGAGLLGRIFLAEVAIHYYRDESYFTQAPWRASRAESGGGVLMNQGIHFADLLLWYLGPAGEVRSAVSTVREGYGEEDVAAALLEMESGALATLTASTVAYPGFPETLTLYGTEGTCTLAEGKGVIRWEQKGRAPLPDPPAGAPAPEGLPAKLGSMYRNHVDFLAAIREGRETLARPAESLAVVAFMEKLYVAARARQM
ncbi:MAG: Gfo/Idh/MocA family oxidoreductase, partial [Nitrospinota bacterium]